MDSSILKTAGPVSPTAMLFKCDVLIIGAERSYEGMMPATVIRQLWPHSFLVSPEVLLLQSAGVHVAHPSTFTELRFGLAHKKLLRPESLAEHEKRLPYDNIVATGFELATVRSQNWRFS